MCIVILNPVKLFKMISHQSKQKTIPILRVAQGTWDQEV